VLASSIAREGAKAPSSRQNQRLEFRVDPQIRPLCARDGEQGFRTCAQGVTSPNLKTLFEAVARRCAEGAAELEAKIRGLGGQPAQGGSVSGSMHRAWINIESTITGMNEHAVLTECERGEDAGKHVYEAALKQDLPVDVRTIIERQFQGVKANHDRVRDLRNAAA
jgi:uncharacterized protein (TIGR02284 family)